MNLAVAVTLVCRLVEHAVILVGLFIAVQNKNVAGRVMWAGCVSPLEIIIVEFSPREAMSAIVEAV